MKNTNKNVTGAEQKIYPLLIGIGICALALVTLIYGVKSRNSSSLVDQNVKLGENNPVSGPVAKTDLQDSSAKETTEASSEVEEETTEKAKESMAPVNVYNGKDKLGWPVTGSVIIPYSMDTTVYFETLDQYQCNPALYMKAEKGTPVMAIFGGTVSAVTEDDRYGKMITVDMGNGYTMTYGQLENIGYQKGDLVETGTQLGTIAEPTDYFLLEGSHLYLKMMKNGEPLNPTDYMEP